MIGRSDRLYKNEMNDGFPVFAAMRAWAFSSLIEYALFSLKQDVARLAGFNIKNEFPKRNYDS